MAEGVCESFCSILETEVTWRLRRSSTLMVESLSGLCCAYDKGTTLPTSRTVTRNLVRIATVQTTCRAPSLLALRCGPTRPHTPPATVAEACRWPKKQGDAGQLSEKSVDWLAGARQKSCVQARSKKQRKSEKGCRSETIGGKITSTQSCDDSRSCKFVPFPAKGGAEGRCLFAVQIVRLGGPGAFCIASFSS
jgi:hypothetical protein